MSFPDDQVPIYPDDAWRRAIAQFKQDWPGREFAALPMVVKCAYVADFVLPPAPRTPAQPEIARS